MVPCPPLGVPLMHKQVRIVSKIESCPLPLESAPLSKILRTLAGIIVQVL